MVNFVSWREARARVREEPVIFAELVSDAPGGQQLEVHLMYPTSKGLHEAERLDTGCMSTEDVRELVTSIAARSGVRYAAIHGAEDHWPPEWVQERANARSGRKPPGDRDQGVYDKEGSDRDDMAP